MREIVVNKIYNAMSFEIKLFYKKVFEISIGIIFLSKLGIYHR